MTDALESSIAFFGSNVCKYTPDGTLWLKDIRDKKAQWLVDSAGYYACQQIMRQNGELFMVSDGREEKMLSMLEWNGRRQNICVKIPKETYVFPLKEDDLVRIYCVHTAGVLKGLSFIDLYPYDPEKTYLDFRELSKSQAHMVVGTAECHLAVQDWMAVYATKKILCRIRTHTKFELPDDIYSRPVYKFVQDEGEGNSNFQVDNQYVYWINKHKSLVYLHAQLFWTVQNEASREIASVLSPTVLATRVQNYAANGTHVFIWQAADAFGENPTDHVLQCAVMPKTELEDLADTDISKLKQVLEEHEEKPEAIKNMNYKSVVWRPIDWKENPGTVDEMVATYYWLLVKSGPNVTLISAKAGEQAEIRAL